MRRQIIMAITLPGTERAPRAARLYARELLGPDHPALDPVLTCVSEAVTNAVRHTASGAGGKVGLLFAAEGGHLVAEVADDGAAGARPRLHDDPLAEHGRGLRIIAALAESWGARPDGDRTTVWMRFPALLRDGYPHST
ncbi:ATP-binding protein [Actinomadura craniellae]|nr:ATP-binding protein [Actinomadura craniellae]